MKLSKLISNIKMKYPFQGKRRRNREALSCLSAIGFPLPEIRRALIYLNGLTVTEIADSDFSQPAISNTIRGIRTNPAIRQKIAEKLSLNVEEMFPD